MKKKVIELLRSAMDIESVDINVEDVLADFSEWDSLARMVLIASLDENFGISIESKAFEKLITVGDLVVEVEKRSELKGK